MWKTVINNILNRQKRRAFLQNLEQDKGVHFLHFYSVQGFKSQPEQQTRKRNKNRYRDQRSQIILIRRWHEYAQSFQQKSLRLDSKVSEHKIYTQRSAAFLRANNTFSEKETRETHQSQQLQDFKYPDRRLLNLVSEMTESHSENLEDTETRNYWQNKYCENGYITQNSRWFQCDFHQNSSDILLRTRKKI